MVHFIRYFLVGIINTSVHWSIFFVVFHFYGLQSVANALAFVASVLTSYVLNSLFTFKQTLAGKKFILFTLFMGCMNICLGFVADIFTLHPLITLVFSSGFSLVVGFLFSKFVVFREVKTTTT